MIYRSLKIYHQRPKEKIDEYHKNASLLGAKILGKSEKPGYLDYLMSCGHIGEYRPEQIVKKIARNADNNYACEACYADRRVPNMVYILRLSHPFCKWIKLGYTKDLDQRLHYCKEGAEQKSTNMGYGFPEEVELENIWYMQFPTKNKAEGYENFLHVKYEEYKMNTKYMKQLHTLSGATECYPDFLWETFIQELSERNYCYNCLYHGNLLKHLPKIYKI